MSNTKEMKIVAMIESGLGKESPTLAEIRYHIDQLRVNGLEPCELLCSQNCIYFLEDSLRSLSPLPNTRREGNEIWGIPALIREGEFVIRAARTEHNMPDHFPATIAINKSINWAKSEPQPPYPNTPKIRFDVWKTDDKLRLSDPKPKIKPSSD